MAKVNPIKLLSIALSLVILLSSCSLLSGPGLPTQIPDVAITLQINPTQAQTTATAPPDSIPTAIASPTSAPLQANAPIWSVYNYTCEFVVSGGNMTMNLNWTDRSNNEEGYRVYRDQQVIATLAPNSTSYVDVAYVAKGKTLSYSVEAFNKDWRASTSTITYGCQ